MSSFRRLFGSASLVLAPLLTGCESATGPEPAPDPLLVTDAGAYALTPAGEGVFEAVIPYRFENLTGAPVALQNCGGTFSLGLERWDGEVWVRAWSPTVALCRSAPIVVGTGAVLGDTIRVQAALPEQGPVSALPVEGVAGVYRIVWDFPLGEYVEGFPESGIRLAKSQRVSNPFDLLLP